MKPGRLVSLTACVFMTLPLPFFRSFFKDYQVNIVTTSTADRESGPVSLVAPASRKHYQSGLIPGAPWWTYPYNRSKPTLIVMMGPPKTGSTTQQCTLSHLNQTLYEQDGWLYMGEYLCLSDITDGNSTQSVLRRFRECEDSADPASSCWNEIKSEFDQFRQQQEEKQIKGLIWSAEGFGIDVVKRSHMMNRLQLLFDKIAPHWGVEVVVTYRRFFEHVVSIHYQVNQSPNGWFPINQWPGLARAPGKVRISPLNTAMKILGKRAEEMSESIVQFPGGAAMAGSYAVASGVQSVFENATNVELYVISLHDEDMVQTMICDYLKAQSACQNYLREKEQEGTVKQNPGKPLAYDMLAMEVFDREWIQQPQIFSRVEAREHVQQLLREANVTSLHTLPSICPSNETMDKIYEVSWKIEQWMLFGHSQRNASLSEIHQFDQGFERAIEKKKACGLSAPETVGVFQEQWKPHFLDASAA